LDRKEENKVGDRWQIEYYLFIVPTLDNKQALCFAGTGDL
jgi:hypothetical protein